MIARLVFDAVVSPGSVDVALSAGSSARAKETNTAMSANNHSSADLVTTIEEDCPHVMVWSLSEVTYFCKLASIEVDGSLSCVAAP
jgi:hypothetical protein